LTAKCTSYSTAYSISDIQPLHRRDQLSIDIIPTAATVSPLYS